MYRFENILVFGLLLCIAFVIIRISSTRRKIKMLMHGLCHRIICTKMYLRSRRADGASYKLTEKDKKEFVSIFEKIKNEYNKLGPLFPSLKKEIQKFEEVISRFFEEWFE